MRTRAASVKLACHVRTAPASSRFARRDTSFFAVVRCRRCACTSEAHVSKALDTARWKRRPAARFSRIEVCIHAVCVSCQNLTALSSFVFESLRKRRRCSTRFRCNEYEFSLHFPNRRWRFLPCQLGIKITPTSRRLLCELSIFNFHVAKCTYMILAACFREARSINLERNSQTDRRV